MTRTKFCLDGWFPVGVDGRTERMWLCVGLAAAGLYSLCGFGYRFGLALSDLYTSRWRPRVLISGVLVPPFPQVLGNALTGFAALALCMPVAAALHYAWHWQGSKSIYLMRRLPQRRELWRRCLAGPLVGAACCALAAGLALLLFFMVYRFQTPEGHLPPDLWAGIGGIV